MNSFGTLFRITLYGESHQKAIGVIIDGMPAGVLIDHDQIKSDLDQRRPNAIGTTKRVETDAYEILSGVFNGRSTGSPIHLMIPNKDINSKDYENLLYHPRPGHADFVASKKYQGFQDYRGGGRFSGRLTAALVAAGSFAKMILPYTFSYQIKQIGTCTNLEHLDDYLAQIQEDKDSVGGIIELRVHGMDIGLGEPFFGKLDALIAHMMFSIPAVKGLNIGTGFAGIDLLGSTFNDPIITDQGKTQTNHSGGIQGGISNGNDLVLSVFIKPAASIGKAQHSFHFGSHEIKTLEIEGRHDVAIARRAGIVLENALAIVLADLYLQCKAYS